VRDFIKSIIKERREQASKEKIDSENFKDFLSILLSDANFENDKAIVDECMTFFLAGSVTTP
jgi:cytochrome P450